MKIGFVGTSRKENEKRIAIHPEFLEGLSQLLKSQIVFETNYGVNFGFENEYFSHHGLNIADREALFDECDILVLPKPVPEDLLCMKESQVLFGWAHCVQQHEITQQAINRKLTIIAWEAMQHWDTNDKKEFHVFYKNNELAGYSAVLHCLQLLGIDGHYGSRKKVVVLSYGAVSRGAIYALQGRGFNNIHVLTQRPPHLVDCQNPDVYHGQYFYSSDGVLMARDSENNEQELFNVLKTADIICNGVLQDTHSPYMFVNKEQSTCLKQGTLIVDISCDQGMGFAFAQPTSFDQPIIQLSNRCIYYSVDHTPAYLWNAASREISKAILPYLPIIVDGDKAWKGNRTISKAIEIQDGIVLNQNILDFQKREQMYPHAYINQR